MGKRQVIRFDILNNILNINDIKTKVLKETKYLNYAKIRKKF